MRIDLSKIGLLTTPAVLALAARLYGLADKPLWLDEVITQKRANLPLAASVSDALMNAHVPTYFMIVRAFDAPVIDEWMLRLPSAVFGALAALLVTLIASETRAPRAGFVAGVLMALSPFEVQFSQEARSYAMVSAFVLLALWGLVRIAKAETTAAPQSPRSGWIAYAVGTIGALNLLLLSIIWLLASNLAMTAIAARARSRGRLVRNWLITQTIILAAWLPALIAIGLARHNDPLRGYGWIPPSTWQHISSVFSTVYLFRISDITNFAQFPAAVPGFGFVVVALAVFGAWRLRREPELLVPIGLAFVAMPASLLVASYFHHVGLPRYLAWSTGPFFVLAGIGAAALPRLAYAPAAAAVVIAGLVNLAPYYRAETKPRWDLAAAYLATHARAGDSIVANDAPAKTMLEAYGARYRLGQPIIDGYRVERISARLSPTGRVWIVSGRTGQGQSAPPEAYLEKWSARGPSAEIVRIGRHIVVARFDSR
jgi:mannosyltransferase